MVETKCVLMAIKPRFAQAIINGNKIIELRKQAPKIVANDLILFYETAPVSAVSFFCEVEDIIAQEPKTLWTQHKRHLSISEEEYNAYFLGKNMAYGIKLRKPRVFSEKKPIRDVDKTLVVPQSYIYVPKEAIEKIRKWAVLD